MSDQSLSDCGAARRQMLISGAATASGIAVSAIAGSASAASGSTSGPTPSPVTSPSTPPFMMPLPTYSPKTPVSSLNPPSSMAPVAGSGECGRPTHQRWTDFEPKKFYELFVQEADHEFHPNLPRQKIWGYDGILPGPTFQARYGEPIMVRIHNQLPANHVGYGTPEISTHLHNLHCGSESDGFTGDYYSTTKCGPTMSGPGEYKDHLYSNCKAGYDNAPATDGDPTEALGTLWYHDHRLDFTAQNVYKGLSGFYLIFDEIDSGNETDPNPNALRLPSGIGKYDIPLVFQDKSFDSSGYMVFDQFNTDGILGDKFCVNGKIQPYFKVEPRKYRFRLLDGGPSRFYEFYLTYNGVDQNFIYLANDGNLLPAPLTMNKVRLSVAERADIVIDFSKYPPGTSLYLVNKLEQLSGRGPTGNILNPGTQLLRFDIGSSVSGGIDRSQVPLKLRDLPMINLREVVTTRIWEFTRSPGGWSVNDKLFDVSVASATPKQGTAEIWVLRVRGDWTHPIHIHFEEGRILTRNGVAPPPHERGRKDVYSVGNNEELRIFLRFRDYVGKYMMHCHNLVHEDHAMMIRWDIVK